MAHLDRYTSNHTFMDQPSECLWLLSTHLKGMHPAPFKSFVLVGNEDSPEAVYLYADSDPLVSDKATLIDLTLQYKEAA